MYDPNYKMKFKPTPARRLSKYEYPIRMAGDPDWGGGWEGRCRAVYEYMIAIKRGVVPPNERRGLWLHKDGA
jgi:hypothetical protein